MNSTDRISFLQNLKMEDPEDPFSWYCYCLETTKMHSAGYEDDWDEMLQKFPTYLPSYYQAGLCFLSKGNRIKAIKIWQHGIVLATQQSNAHALTELKSILQNTLIEEDD